jgi:hypothetical protein
VVATLEHLIESQKWFHAIDFGAGTVSPGRFGRDVPPNYTLYGVFEWLRGLSLQGARVVDVGTMDGLVAFIAKTRGAAEVIATDMARRDTFEAGRERLGLDINYQVPVTIADLPALLGPERADVVVMAGVLYHRPRSDGGHGRVPSRAQARRLRHRRDDVPVRRRRRAHVLQSGRHPRAVSITPGVLAPSRRALEGMFELAGFEVLGSIAVDGRIATLGRARRPSRSARVARASDDPPLVHEVRQLPRAIDFDELERDQGASSSSRRQRFRR